MADWAVAKGLRMKLSSSRQHHLGGRAAMRTYACARHGLLTKMLAAVGDSVASAGQLHSLNSFQAIAKPAIGACGSLGECPLHGFPRLSSPQSDWRGL